MIEQITELMVHSGAEWVLWLMFGLSVVSSAIALERAFEFRRAQADLSTLVPELRSRLRKHDYEAARALLEGSDSVAGRVVASGLCEVESGPTAAEEAMAAALGIERRRLGKRLLILGTVGNNAPFVGLLGTVIGVVGAFDALGKPQAIDQALGAAAAMAPERVMGTIAEALVATAVGLLVAIPAVAVFNHFQSRIGDALTDAETLGHVLLSHLSGEGARQKVGPKAKLASVQPLRDSAE